MWALCHRSYAFSWQTIVRPHALGFADMGTVDLLSTALPGAQAQVQSGVMRGLAITTKQRWPSLPDVATLDEQGFPDVR